MPLHVLLVQEHLLGQVLDVQSLLCFEPNWRPDSLVGKASGWAVITVDACASIGLCLPKARVLSGEANCGGVEVASLAGGKAAGWAAIKGFGSPGGQGGWAFRCYRCALSHIAGLTRKGSVACCRVGGLTCWRESWGGCQSLCLCFHGLGSCKWSECGWAFSCCNSGH